MLGVVKCNYVLSIHIKRQIKKAFRLCGSARYDTKFLCCEEVLFITDFIKNPLHIIMGVLSVPTMYLCHEVYPVFLKAKYPFSHQDTINFEILLLCLCLLLIFGVLSFNDYRNKTSTTITKLNDIVFKLQKDNDQKDENVKGLIQSKNKITNERNENRVIISNLESKIGQYDSLFASVAQRLDHREVLEIKEEISQTTTNIITEKD
ncbi:MAG: hypothetical protein ABF723_13730 [Lentilactobacillus hilgardii]|uniref:hypothetical protein n=1 Tax=Lentilactobacillus hilgardii TaxID=1588 RepID=UPI0039E91983